MYIIYKSVRAPGPVSSLVRENLEIDPQDYLYVLSFDRIDRLMLEVYEKPTPSMYLPTYLPAFSLPVGTVILHFCNFDYFFTNVSRVLIKNILDYTGIFGNFLEKLCYK